MGNPKKKNRRSQIKKERCFLIGPFIGELAWEYYRFAPYIIHLKREHPTIKFIVFTRKTRFDLYGKYADILIPLKIPEDSSENQLCFKMKNINVEQYEIFSRSFKKQYENKYKIVQHICPDISMFYYQLRWQYSRTLMNYDFKPRINNKKIVDRYISSYDILLDIETEYEYSKNIKKVSHLEEYFVEYIDHNSSITGCLIESIKKCKYVIGNLSSDVSRLALLLKTPLITINEKLNDDDIHLINPYNTPVIRALNIDEGIKYYENNF